MQRKAVKVSRDGRRIALAVLLHVEQHLLCTGIPEDAFQHVTF
jgi:hypothetical protein